MVTLAVHAFPPSLDEQRIVTRATSTVIGWAELCVPRDLAEWRERCPTGQPPVEAIHAWPAVTVDVDGERRTFHDFSWGDGAVRVCTDADLPVVVSFSGGPPLPGRGDRLTRLRQAEQARWVEDWRRRAWAEG